MYILYIVDNLLHFPSTFSDSKSLIKFSLFHFGGLISVFYVWANKGLKYCCEALFVHVMWSKLGRPLICASKFSKE